MHRTRGLQLRRVVITCCYLLIITAPLSYAASPLLRLQGSNTIGAQLAPALVVGLLNAKGFKQIQLTSGHAINEQRVLALNPAGQEVFLDIFAHGSGTGFSALAASQAELAASSRPIKAEEALKLSHLGKFPSGQTEHVIAIDALAIIAHPSNPISTLNTEQLAGLFSGSISHWQALDGPGLPVRVYARDDNSGTYDTFNELVLTRHNAILTTQAQRFESSSALSEAVSRDPAAIGFIGRPYVRKAKALAIASGESVAMLPTPELVATEDYPLSRRLYWYSAANSSNLWQQALIEFTQSRRGQEIVAQNGFIAQDVQALAQDSTERPPHYQQLSATAQRLTVNFRFQEGISSLDSKAMRDIERLVSYLKRHQLLHKKVVLVGFGDPNADPARSQLLSKLRAMAVRKELVRQGVFVKEISGFGDALPVASNTDESGRARNRRVEVWID